MYTNHGLSSDELQSNCSGFSFSRSATIIPPPAGKKAFISSIDNDSQAIECARALSGIGWTIALSSLTTIESRLLNVNAFDVFITIGITNACRIPTPVNTSKSITEFGIALVTCAKVIILSGPDKSNVNPYSAHPKVMLVKTIDEIIAAIVRPLSVFD